MAWTPPRIQDRGDSAYDVDVDVDYFFAIARIAARELELSSELQGGRVAGDRFNLLVYGRFWRDNANRLMIRAQAIPGGPLGATHFRLERYSGHIGPGYADFRQRFFAQLKATLREQEGG
jgi:hypothetical protein